MILLGWMLICIAIGIWNGAAYGLVAAGASSSTVFLGWQEANDV